MLSMRRKDKGTIQEMLEFNAVHDINYENITITTGSGAVVLAMPKNMLLNVPQSETCENKLCRVAIGLKSKDLGGEKTRSRRTDPRSYEIQGCGRD